MCHKVVRIYRQTFRNSDATKSQQSFLFNRIYKTKQSDQFFRISVMGISGIAADTNANNYLLLRNLPEMTMYSNFQAISATGVRTTTSDFYLGNLHDRDFLQDNTVILDTLPLNEFVISASLPCDFTVSFKIELCEH